MISGRSGWAWKYYGNGLDIKTAGRNHNCTLYVAWRLDQAGVSDPGSSWGDARGWIDRARGSSNVPTVGSVAWWGWGGQNHVAYVESVNGDEVLLREDNLFLPDQYGNQVGPGYTRSRWVKTSSVQKFLDFGVTGKSTAAPQNGITDGVFVAFQGRVYRMAGGAPIYVSSWNAFGGGRPVRELSAPEFRGLRTTPANGTFIRGTRTGEVYRVVGGAPIYVSTWNAFGGGQPYVDVDQAAIDMAGQGGIWNHLRATPTDGTFVTGAQRGEVYRFAGGAPLYVSTWNAFGGPQPTTPVDQAAIDMAGHGGVWSHVRTTPTDGTFISGAQRGEVYRVAGGAPLYVSTWNAFGGPQPVTTVDQAAVDRAGQGGIWNHLRATPTDGTFVTGAQRGEVYRFAGGAPLYVSTWNAFGGPQPTTPVDIAALDNAGRSGLWSHVRATPADNTYISGSSTGRVYQVIGGVARYVSHWDQVGGPKSATSVDQAAIDNAGRGGLWNHLSGVGAL